MPSGNMQVNKGYRMILKCLSTTAEIGMTLVLRAVEESTEETTEGNDLEIDK